MQPWLPRQGHLQLHPWHHPWPLPRILQSTASGQHRQSNSLFPSRDNQHFLYLTAQKDCLSLLRNPLFCTLLPSVSSHTDWDSTVLRCCALFSVCHFLSCPLSLLSCRITQSLRFKKTSKSASCYE